LWTMEGLLKNQIFDTEMYILYHFKRVAVV
jgi:hypothetical protein